MKQKTTTFNFQNMLYYGISKRFRDYRKANKLTQNDLYNEIYMIMNESENSDGETIGDSKIISRIECCHVSHQNPYLFPRGILKPCCDVFNVSAKQLICGTNSECENFIKIILLAIIMNGDCYNSVVTNPFSHFDNINDLVNWAYPQRIDDDQELFIQLACAYETSQQKKCITNTTVIPQSPFPNNESLLTHEITGKELENQLNNYFINKYGFFYSEENYNLYEKLETKYIPEFDKISNLLLRLVLNDPIFARSFIQHLYNEIISSAALAKLPNPPALEKIHSLKEFTLYQGQYGNLALDYKGPNYHIFISAFNKFWENHKKDFMSYFEKNFFSNLKENTWLKEFKNDFFHSMITAPEFQRFIENILYTDIYNSKDAIVSSTYIDSSIKLIFSKQRAIAENNRDPNNTEWNFFFNFFNIVSAVQDQFKSMYEQ